MRHDPCTEVAVPTDAWMARSGWRAGGLSPRAEACYQRLREAIVQGELRPNERLSERRLGEMLEASRTPVREALQQLAVDRLVVSTDRGWLVFEHSRQEIHHIYALRAALETHAARLAARRCARTTVTDDTPWQFLRDSGLDADLDPDRLVATNEAFHDTLLHFADSPLVRDVGQRSRLYYFNRRIAASYTPSAIDRSRTQHRHLLERILAGDEDGAAALALQHVEEALDMIDRYLDVAPDRPESVAWSATSPRSA